MLSKYYCLQISSIFNEEKKTRAHFIRKIVFDYRKVVHIIVNVLVESNQIEMIMNKSLQKNRRPQF